jgi:hypothetical protein
MWLKYFKSIVLLSAVCTISTACDKEQERTSSSSSTEKGSETQSGCANLVEEETTTTDDEVTSDSTSEGTTTTDATSTDTTSTDTEDTETATDTLAEDLGEESNCFPDNDSENADTTGGGTGWDAGLGLEGCTSEGNAWIGVQNGGPASCGDPLVSWCCSEGNIQTKFPNYADLLQEKFTSNNSAGYKLYHCSAVGDSHKFHFGMADGSGFKYKYITLTGTPAESSEPASCTTVTSADLGILQEAVISDDDDDDTEDVTIGGIVMTEEAILEALNVDRVQDSYPNLDAAVRDSEGNSPHGKVKTFFNQSLVDSFDNDTHALGSIAISERYENDETTVKGWVVKFKLNTDSDDNSWHFYEIEKDPDFDSATPAPNEAGASDCVSCHSSDSNDYIKGSLPAAAP